MFYKRIVKPILFCFDPETVHDLFTTTGEFLGKFSLTRKLVHLLYGYRGRDISRVVDGVKYRVPIILSAGFDYNARLTQILPSIGLGGVEVGSVTARPCEGNPTPRLTRLPKNKSILVNKGLRNDGVEAIIKRLRKTPRIKDFVIGVSIARTNDVESSRVEDGIEDYAYSFKRLNEENIGDYYTINISCPNAFGGETFTTPELLTKLLSRLETVKTTKPVYIKLPINLSWDEADKLCQVVADSPYQGIVAGNLNKKYESLDIRDEAPQEYRGGLSGKPCFELSNTLVYKIKEKYGQRLTVIGVGGVLREKDALYKFELGSDLLEMITGIIFEGPSIVRRIAHTLSEKDPNHTSSYTLDHNPITA
jgi:dihydroorotate dehydrogenase